MWVAGKGVSSNPPIIELQLHVLQGELSRTEP